MKTTMKITTTTKKLDDVAKKYCRLVLTEDTPTWHRLVETKDGKLEYRMGAGKWKEMTPRKFRIFLRSIVQAAKSHQIEHLAVELSRSPFPQLNHHSESWVVSTIVENFKLAAYEFSTYKTKKPEKKELKEILICGGLNKAAQAGFQRGQIVGDYVNKARDIANTPGDDMSPSKLAAAAKATAQGTRVSVTVFDHKRIQKEGLHALWAVGKGADDLPRFIIMEYWGAGKPSKNSKDKAKQPIALIGKGITYDTGGLNVKPTGAMHDMHLDMSGGAAMIASICCAAKLGVKKNIVAIIPAAENAVSAKSMRAGDIIKSHSGKTIEVLHTDAEGRLVLADGLSYVKKYNPKVIIDAATLTGAALVALGQHASAVMTKDDSLRDTLSEIGEQSGDYVWPLPLWEEYEAPLKKTRADVCNIAHNFAKVGGTIEAGTFLSFFAPKNTPWAHIDIAPRMTAVEKDKLALGATGEPVRLLVSFVEST